MCFKLVLKCMLVYELFSYKYTELKLLFDISFSLLWQIYVLLFVFFPIQPSYYYTRSTKKKK